MNRKLLVSYSLVALVLLVLLFTLSQTTVFEDGSIRVFNHSACFITDWGCGQFEWFHKVNFNPFQAVQ